MDTDPTSGLAAPAAAKQQTFTLPNTQLNKAQRLLLRFIRRQSGGNSCILDTLLKCQESKCLSPMLM